MTEETFDEIAKKIDQLQELPSDISDVVEKKYTDITNDITKTTITRDEFAHFQLMVIRDTCQLRVRSTTLPPETVFKYIFFSITRVSGSHSRREVSLAMIKTTLLET